MFLQSFLPSFGHTRLVSTFPSPNLLCLSSSIHLIVHVYLFIFADSLLFLSFPSSRPHFFLFLYFRLFSFLFFLFLFPFLSLKYPSLALQLSLLVILSLPSFPAQTNLSSVTLSISITLFLSVSQLYLSLLFSLCNL